MATLLINSISTSDKESQIENLEKAIDLKITENDRFKVNDQSWMVNFDGTPRELSLFLGVQGGALGSVLISDVSNISGYGPNAISKWFKSHNGGDING